MSWIECPHCGLRHSERESKTCPRCRKDVTAASGDDLNAEDVYRPPSDGGKSTPAMFSIVADADEDPGSLLGTRVAGLLLVLNAAALFYAAFAIELPLTLNVGSGAVDVILGLFLLSGKRGVVPFVLFRVIVGGLVYLVTFLTVGDVASAAMQVALSGSVFGLLLGTPSFARVALSGMVGALYLLSTVYLLYLGTRVRSSESLLASSEIEAVEPGGVQGVGFDYSLQVPNEHWFVRNEEVTKRDNPMADRWLVRPDRDAHFMIIGERLPRMGVDVGDYEQAVLQNLENAAMQLQVLESGQGNQRQSRLLRARAVMQGLSIDYSYAIVVSGDPGFQFIGFASEKDYPSVEAEIRQLQDSVVIGSR